MLLLLPSTSRTGILKTNMVHPRKRQRQTAEPCCSSSSESENGDAAALSSSCDEEEQCPLKQQSSSSSSASPVMLPVLIRQQNQRKRTRRRRLLSYSSSNRRRYSSWTSLATLLLWLCGSSDASWGSGNRTTTKKGLLNVAKSCRKEEIIVQAAYMVCDSPGAYYRGSGTYRDSTTCVYGDKARLQLVCKYNTI